MHTDLFKIIVSIADVHIGNRNISPAEYRYQLKNGVLKKLENMMMIDGIIICGDTLHEKLPLDSEYSNIFFWFISKLIKIAKEKSAFIRIIRGTQSHDMNQLENIKSYEEDDDINFKIIDTKCEEVIDEHIYAFIPEEYVADKNKYYKDIIDKPDNYYDFIFGHGLLENCKFMHQESENHNTKAPVFFFEELSRICKGPVSFGHIHTPMNIMNKFFYIGSTLRTCHGEEHDKGWNVILYIKEKGLYRVDKIINEFTFNFNTLKLNSMFIENNTVDQIVKHVDEFRKKHNTDKLSLVITCIDYKETTAKIHLLKKYFSQDKNIRTSFKIMSRKAYEKEQAVQNNKEVKSYLQEGLPIEQRIKLWALEKRQINLEESDISRFLKRGNLERKESVMTNV